MQFQIKKVILWPRKKFKRREIVFSEGEVNVISGASKTGKSAVIPIIDYCLCSNKCAIPVGVIREECEWFGVLVNTVEGEKLFARREPGEKKQTGDMFVLEADNIMLPDEIETKNSTVKQVKDILNGLAGLSNLGMFPQSEGYGAYKTGFRDLMAFTFQPQNIVANPDVLFFKADTTEHREKLKTIFPYILNAVSQQTLADRWELDRLTKTLKQKESEMNAAKVSVSNWISEAQSWIQQASELGLISIENETPEEWPLILELLTQISKSTHRDARTSLPAIDESIKELIELQSAEAKEAAVLTAHRQRLLEIKRLIESSKSYGDAMFVQRDRLAISKWIRDLSKNSDDTLSSIAEEKSGQLDQLCSALEGLELEVQSQTTVFDKLDKEQIRLRAGAENSIARLNGIHSQIRKLERISEDSQKEIFRSDQIERYLGRLEQAISLYNLSGEDAKLNAEIATLASQVTDVRGRISETKIKSKVKNSLASIESIAGQIIPTLDAEWPDAAINFVIKDLTLKIVQGTRDDYLWEIGSGANWLAYHVAISLAFQRFFRQTPAHAVPNFLVYDQPSQVYFPQSPRHNKVEVIDWRDEDIIAVQKIFSAVSMETKKAEGKLQIILLDHADKKIWGDIENVTIVEEWRDGKKLVPIEWINSN